jgi:hypothetical protein
MQRTTLVLQPIRFGEYLFEKNALSDEQLLDALADHWSNGGRLGAAIMRCGHLTPEQVEKYAAEYHALNVIEIDG